MDSGYVYSGILDLDSLKDLFKEINTENPLFYIKEAIDDYQISEKLPDVKIPRNGSVFSDKGEIRWDEKEGMYHVLVLTEEEIKKIPNNLLKIEGNWRIKKNKKLFLVPLKMGHISPNFKHYPYDAKYLFVCYYLNNEKNYFISPRRFEK